MACPKIACECHPGGRKMRKLGDRVLLWGDSYAATDTAAFLANIGKRVTIVTENREFAADCRGHPHVRAAQAVRTEDAEVLTSRPYKHPVTVLTSTTVDEIRDGEVVLRDKDFNRTVLAVDDVVACHTRPETRAVQRASCGRGARPERGRLGQAAQPLPRGQGRGRLRSRGGPGTALQPQWGDRQRPADRYPGPAQANGRAGLHPGAHERADGRAEKAPVNGKEPTTAPVG